MGTPGKGQETHAKGWTRQLPTKSASAAQEKSEIQRNIERYGKKGDTTKLEALQKDVV